MTKKLNLTIRQGETFQRIIRWERPPFIYRAITGITKAAPVEITAPGHGLVNGWRAAVVTVGGMEEINAPHTPPRDNEFHQVTVLDVDTVTINDINSAEYSPYTSGGYLQFYTPVDLTGYTAEIDIKDRLGGAVLMSLSTVNGRIVLDLSNKTITLTIPAAATASDVLTWTKGVWDLEMKSPTGQVTTLFSGSVSVAKEVTTE
jgi:hypothetical protein